MSVPRRVNPWYLVVLVFLLGIFVARLPATISGVTGQYSFWDPMLDVHAMLQSNHVDPWDEDLIEEMQISAIDGMLEALNDDYAQYIPPAEQQDFEKSMTGEFVGIGAEVRMDTEPIKVDGESFEKGYLWIVSPLEDSPAYRAGIMADDRVTHIGGESTLPLSVDDCIALLKGTPGTPVEVRIERDGAALPEPITIVRDRIVVRAVRGVERGLGDGHYNFMIDRERRIAYVRLTQFIPTAADEFRAAITEATGTGALNGLIIDLRGNPGGVLDAALEITDMFVEEGAIVSVRGRDGANETVHKARRRGTLTDLPIAVLVNGASASASEIVSGALQDHDRAIVIGTRSFGKGLVQTVRGLPSVRGAQIKFTAQKYYLPNGRLIQRTDGSAEWGVDPDPGYYIPVTGEEELERFMARRDLDIIRDVAKEDAAPTDWANAAWVEGEMHDKQLAGALRVMQGKVDTGAFEPLSDAEGQYGEIALAELRQLELARQRYARQFRSIQRRVEVLAEATNGEPEVPDEYDLWDDDLELNDGTIDVHDKDGNLVATLRIKQGNRLETWLLDLVEPIDASDDDSGADGE